MAIEVRVIYALPQRQAVRMLKLEEGACINDAIVASGLLQEFPEIDLARNRVGVFGRLARLDAALQAGDQVEIYRPLAADPREARRRRAARAR